MQVRCAERQVKASGGLPSCADSQWQAMRMNFDSRVELLAWSLLELAPHLIRPLQFTALTVIP